MKAVENAFAVLWERHPTDKERQRLMRGRDAVGIKDNDALWTLLMVLDHYETLYERFPALIAKAASDVTDNARASAEAELKAAAARTRAELTKAVARSAHDIAGRVASAQRSKWFLACALVATATFVGAATSIFRVGVSSGVAAGRLAGYSEARNEKAAAAWVITAEGQLGYALAKAGSIRELATCAGKNLLRRGDTCLVRCGRETPFSWRLR